MCKIIEDMLREEWKEGFKEGFREGYQEGLKIAALELLKDGKLAHEKIAYSNLQK